MKRSPSIKRLDAAFPGKGAALRALLKGDVKTRSYKSVQDLERSCYNPPDYAYRLLTAANEIAETFGVEAITDKNGIAIAEYLNTGYAYTPTLVRYYRSGHITVASWGDVAEANR